MSRSVAPLATAPARSPRVDRSERFADADAVRRMMGTLAAAVTVALGVAVLWYVVALPVDAAADRGGTMATAPFVTGMVGLALAGAAVVRQQPRATVGWLLVATAVASVAGRFSLGLAIDAHRQDASWANAAGWVTNWSWAPGQAMALVLFLRFPDGALPAPGWKWVERAVLAWLALTVASTALLPGHLGAEPLAGRTNPLGTESLEPGLSAALDLLFGVAPLLALCCVAAPVSRWRGADPEERRQLRPVAAALLVVAVTAPVALVSDAGVVLEGVAYLSLPVAIAWAVLRHRLWDLDLRRRFDRLRAVREEERARLQRELHDTLGPLLGSIGMRAEAARNLLAQGASGRVRAVLDTIDDDTQAAVVEVRRIIDELGPSVLAESDLVAAVRALADGYDGAGLAFELDLPASLPDLDPSRELAAYRVVAEAVRNVVRHAAARRCRISVAIEGNALEVTVIDDGRGLQGHPAGVGRRAMTRRVADHGGTLEVASPESGGVVVRATLPEAVR